MTKLKNSNCDTVVTVVTAVFFFFLKIVTKLKHSNCDKTQFVTKLKKSNCDKTQTKIVEKNPKKLGEQTQKPKL